MRRRTENTKPRQMKLDLRLWRNAAVDIVLQNFLGTESCGTTLISNLANLSIFNVPSS
jgi:hypothetical protein